MAILKDRAEAAHRSAGGQVLSEHDNPRVVRLYDVVEDAWTKPLPEGAVAHYLTKVVYTCSACDFADAKGVGSISTHAEALIDACEAHEGATATRHNREGVGSVILCSACEVTSATMRKWQSHMARFTPAKASAHRTVTARLVQRFSRGIPQASVVLWERPVGEGTVTPVPHAAQAVSVGTPKERSGRRRNRLRGKGRGKHGGD